MAFGDWFKTNIIQPVSTGLKNVSNWTNDNIINPTKDFVNNEIIQPVGNWINKTTNKVQESAEENGVISAIGTGIGETVGKVVEEGKKIGNAVKQPIINAITGKETKSEPSKEINEQEQQKNNEDFNANGNTNALENAEEENLRKMAWDREDAIRKETQAREDTAYQRAVADARKAGINLNLVGINPANSGGGITNATTLESVENAQLNAYTQELIKQMELEFNLSENQKDRWSNLLSRVLGAMILR